MKKMRNRRERSEGSKRGRLEEGKQEDEKKEEKVSRGIRGS